MRNESGCGFGVSESELSEHDRVELEKFKQWIGIETSRRSGGDPWFLNALEAALYPEGIGRTPADGAPEA